MLPYYNSIIRILSRPCSILVPCPLTLTTSLGKYSEASAHLWRTFYFSVLTKKAWAIQNFIVELTRSRYAFHVSAIDAPTPLMVGTRVKISQNGLDGQTT